MGIEGEHLVEAHVVDRPVAEGRGSAHLLAHMARLIVEPLARRAPALCFGVVNLGGVHSLLVFQPARHHHFVVPRTSSRSSKFGTKGDITSFHEHGDDGQLTSREQRRELLPRPRDGVEHDQPDEMALERADGEHHEARSRAAERQPADSFRRGEVGERGHERLPFFPRGIECVQFLPAIFEQK